MGIPRVYYCRWMKLVAKVDSCHKTLLVALVKFTRTKRHFFPKLKRSWSILCFNFMNRVFTHQLDGGTRGSLSSSCIQGKEHKSKGIGNILFHMLFGFYSMSGNTHGTKAFLGNGSWCKRLHCHDTRESGKEKSRRHPKYGPGSNSIFVTFEQDLDIKGTKTIPTRASTTDTKCYSCCHCYGTNL